MPNRPIERILPQFLVRLSDNETAQGHIHIQFLVNGLLGPYSSNWNSLDFNKNLKEPEELHLRGYRRWSQKPSVQHNFLT